MSEIKAGFVGTIRNGDNVLHGRVENRTYGYAYGYVNTFNFRIVGTSAMNTFKLSEWEFTPDVPTATGVYTDRVGDLWYVDANGKPHLQNLPDPKDRVPFSSTASVES